MGSKMQNRLKHFRDRAGLSMQALAAAVGTTAPQISKLEKGERRLTVDWMLRLADVFGIEPAELLPESDGHGARYDDRILPGGEARLGPAFVSKDPRDLIPVRSAARGGSEQEMFLGDGPLDFVGRPRSLAHIREAYSIYMIGDSMFPRFRPGQLLHVNPFKAAPVGAGVVITRADDAVLIKEFVRRDEAVLTVRQYNPLLVLEYPLRDIRDIHTVVGLDEP
jgi:phage repressor protein C with HTH and peptisase S24 domain